MTYWLCGRLGTELTNASTTGLLDTRTMRWASQVADALNVPVKLFPRLRAAGEIAGPMAPALTSRLGLGRPPQVIIGPSHDTAAAVGGIPAADDAFALVCTGTWALAGSSSWLRSSPAPPAGPASAMRPASTGPRGSCATSPGSGCCRNAPENGKLTGGLST
jgi:sugar (pentulose or hexulose) kinase